MTGQLQITTEDIASRGQIVSESVTNTHLIVPTVQ